VLHLVVGPGPPRPHGNGRRLHDGRWLVHDLARRDSGRDCTATEAPHQHPDQAGA
jgi:hypothetical protein